MHTVNTTISRYFSADRLSNIFSGKGICTLAMVSLMGISQQSYAQVPGLPNSSPSQTITQELGLGKVEVAYSRPSVNGRKVFGDLVPYDAVWRTGANTATKITFSGDVTIAGNKIPAGTYSLFSIPGKNEWTIILNKAVNVWGAFTYKQAEDLLRFKVKAASLKEKQETFTILFDNATTQAVDLRLLWEHTTVPVHITVNDDDRIMATIEELMQAPSISNLAYFNAIQYYYLHEKDTEKALQWISKAKKDFPKNASYQLFEARFLLRKGDKEGVQQAVQEGIKVATENDGADRIPLLKAVLKQASH
ncbi:DUF2911 domain-containing protein [Chitinophaga pendula]|uniref:DUF2911 domain-containing protein n=1 Tax=Chitinophaga TaxID=79328 RepID=UPI000BAE8A04|nr:MULTISPECIES: DUF2911 domain-containing protein [Chitinophaga]ASZ12198.1 hypothetical protein CK934_15135 [Chitinophaga sp. MD30]UCJ04772.1 DUF2911 domain-containing protein [Chitinophaga pendula]